MDRNTWRKPGNQVPVPVAAGTKIFAGHIVCANTYGFAVPGEQNPGFTSLGVADETVDNSNGENGDQVIQIRRGASFCFSNSTVQPVPGHMIGRLCYIHDSVTVGDRTGDTPPAGWVLEVTPDGVWVLFEFAGTVQ